MTLDVYLAFVVAATVLIVIPGPSLMVVVSHAMGVGLRPSWFTIFGVAASHTVFFLITALGLSAFLLSFAHIFIWIKWIGVAYLIWMGIKQWRAKPKPLEAKADETSKPWWSLFFQGFAITMTNPKALVFYAMFFPPFLNPANPVVPQLLIMGVTFLLILLLTCFLYALVAAQTRSWFSKPNHIRWQNRITGSLLIGAGVLLATATRSK